MPGTDRHPWRGDLPYSPWKERVPVVYYSMTLGDQFPHPPGVRHSRYDFQGEITSIAPRMNGALGIAVLGPGCIRGWMRRPVCIEAPLAVVARAEKKFGSHQWWMRRYIVGNCRWSNAAAYLDPLAFLSIKYVGDAPPTSLSFIEHEERTRRG